MIYYNDFDEKCCEVLRQQIKNGNLPPGWVDERSIVDVKAEELKKYRQIHLFAGIGAFPLGFKQAGMPDDIFICTGGFPCQDISIAGRREGLAGKRSRLWFEFYRIIDELKPQWVVIENVTGLLSSNKGRDMGTIVGGLAELGYWWAYRVLDAQYFGVPQRRRRVFIVGCLTKGCAQEVLFERESCPWDTPPGRETGQKIARPLANGSTTDHYDESQQTYVTAFAHQAGGDTGLNINKDLSGTLQENQTMAVAFGGNNTQGPVSVATSCNAHGSGRYDFESETFIIPFDMTQITSKENRSNPQPGDPCHPLSSSAHPPAIAATLNNGGNNGGFRTEPGEHLVAEALNSHSTRHGHAMTTQQAAESAHLIPLQIGIRRLTPLECERLQGFPDGWTKCCSDSARYRQLGNAVTVPVAKWIGQRIRKMFDNSPEKG